MSLNNNSSTHPLLSNNNDNFDEVDAVPEIIQPENSVWFKSKLFSNVITIFAVLTSIGLGLLTTQATFSILHDNFKHTPSPTPAPTPDLSQFAHLGFQFHLPKSHNHSLSKRQISSQFVANNNTPTVFQAKILAVYLAETNITDKMNAASAMKLVSAVWVNPQCADPKSNTENSAAITKQLDAGRCDISAGTISDPRPAYDWKLLRYKDNVPVPGDYVVAKDYLNLIGQAKEIGDDFGRQTFRNFATDKTYNYVRLEFCKENNGNAKNVRVEGPGLDTPLEFQSKSCGLHSLPITPPLKLAANAEVVVALSYDVRESLYDESDPPADAANRDVHCAENGRCFMMPQFVPFIYNAAADIKIGDFVYQDTNANGKRDAGENGMRDVKVQLWHRHGADSVMVAETTTSANGTWFFERYEGIFDNGQVVLEPDTNVFLTPSSPYTLRFVLPPLNQPTGKAVIGSPDPPDFTAFLDEKLDAGVITFQAPPPGQEDFTLDMGFVQQFSVGSRVWLDMNSNGVYDEDEDSGIGNVTLALLDDSGQPKYSTVTNDEGQYTMMSLPSGMFPKNPYTIQLDLSQPSLRDVVAGESLTATTFQARGPDPVDDDSDGKLVGNAMHATFFAPDFFKRLPGIDFGLRPFDCSMLAGCSGHGNCVSDAPARCGCEPGWKGENCDVEASMAPTPFSPTPGAGPGVTDASIGGGGIMCNVRDGVPEFIDRCGVCGGNNACETGTGGGGEPGVKPTDPTDDDNFFIYIAAGSGCCVCVVCLLFLVLLKRRANKAKENDELSQSGNMTELGGGPVYAGASSLPDTGVYGANGHQQQYGNTSKIQPMFDAPGQYQDGGAVPRRGDIDVGVYEGGTAQLQYATGEYKEMSLSPSGTDNLNSPTLSSFNSCVFQPLAAQQEFGGSSQQPYATGASGNNQFGDNNFGAYAGGDTDYRNSGYNDGGDNEMRPVY